MFDKIVKSLMNYVLHLCVKNSDVKNLTLEVNELNGKYTLGLASKVVVGTNGISVRDKQPRSKNLAIVFLIALAIMVSFAAAGMLVPNASFGRSFLVISAFPSFLVNIIGARYIIKNI